MQSLDSARKNRASSPVGVLNSRFARGPKNFLKGYAPEFAIFFVAWLLFGAFIKVSDLEAYNLQQMGVASVVDHGTFSLGHSQHPRLQPLGDVFEYEGRKHAAKQPGQFAIGALAYAPLKMLGLEYERDYVRTSAWVTFFAATSFAAGLVALIFSIVTRLWRLSPSSGAFAAIALGLGTPIFAYSGVLHHDVIAAFFILLGFAFGEASLQDRAATAVRSFRLAAGAAFGAAISASMLPALIALALLAQISIRSRGRAIAALGGGFVAACVPLGIHNWHYFGSPLTQANAAGKNQFNDVFFQPAFPQGMDHLWDYLGGGYLSIWMYAPIAGAGLAALASAAIWDRDNRWTWLAAGAAALVHVIYLLGIETTGHCQYGARYLLPLYPILCLPLATIWAKASSRRSSRAFKAAGALAAGGLVLSVAIGFAGAHVGTMLCDFRAWIPGALWRGQGGYAPPVYPLRPWMVAGLSAFAAAYCWFAFSGSAAFSGARGKLREARVIGLRPGGARGLFRRKKRQAGGQ